MSSNHFQKVLFLTPPKESLRRLSVLTRRVLGSLENIEDVNSK